MGDDLMMQVTKDETRLLLEKMIAYEADRPRLLENRKNIRKQICKCLEKNEFKKKVKAFFIWFKKM